jgi:hypothetical protein
MRLRDLTFSCWYPTTPGSGIAQWCIAGLQTGGSEVRVPAGAGNFLFTTASRPALGLTQPPIQWVPRALSLGVERPGRESGHSHPSNAEVKEYGNYTSTPHYAFMAWCWLKSTEISLTFTFNFVLPHHYVASHLQGRDHVALLSLMHTHDKNAVLIT